MAIACSATIRRSCGNSFISCAKPWPSSVPSRFSVGSDTSSKNSSEVSAESMPSFLSLRPRRKPCASSVSTTMSEMPLARSFGIGLGNDNDEVGVLAVGDEGLGAVEHVAVARFHRGGAHALQIGAGAGLAHGDGADQFAGRELRQPALFLLLGAVMQDVGRDDAGMQRRAERVETGQAVFAIDHRLVGERPAGAAVFLGHRGAKQACLPRLGPNLARVHVLVVPFLQMRHEFGRQEAARLLLEQHEILGHPGRARKIEVDHRWLLIGGSWAAALGRIWPPKIGPIPGRREAQASPSGPRAIDRAARRVTGPPSQSAVVCG